MAKQTVSIDFDGREYSLETGKLAKFANGSVMVKCGDTMVLVAATASSQEMPNIDFLPLQVEYREKTASAGKIPGGFLKREARPSDHEVICSRLIDRPIRPMIPKTWRFETQIIATVFSADPEVNSDTLAAVGASAALLISDIPFNGPIAEVRVGRLNGEFIVNPSNEQLKSCDLDITIGGTETAITMVEGEAKEISEEEFTAAMEFGHEQVKRLCALQNELAALIAPVKREFIVDEAPEEFVDVIYQEIKQDLIDNARSTSAKSERSERRRAINEKALAKATEVFGEREEYLEKIEKYASAVVSKLEKKEMRQMILSENQRLDGRKTTEIRPITCEVGLLPRAHGSALFTRGETQSLTTATLGTSRDEKMVDGLEPLYTEHFMLHYNFPPFCTGETGRLGTGRREVGHGHLAWRALKDMLPEKTDFPYTIRVVSDILESNGSSSMATVCAGSLSLFDAGVPMKKPVAGIAMGLIKEGDDVAILSDILGDEDHLGDMDFKVTGTVDGITACQMDIKIEGLSFDIMRQALNQARDGRMHILGIMNETLSEPREDISRFAPKFTSIQIPVDTIGAVIGSGGETIRGIVKDTGCEIDIEDDGTVMIAAVTSEAADEAIRIIRSLTQKPEEGKVYMGTIKEVREGLGAIVEFLPKQSGLLHLSQISYDRFENVGDVLKQGDKIEIKLLEISRDGKYRLSRKALLEKPEGYVEQERPPRSDRPRDDRGGRDRDRRGGDRDRDRDRDRGPRRH